MTQDTNEILGIKPRDQLKESAMNSTSPLMSRYKDGYGVASGFISFGNLIKKIGIILGIIGVIISFALMARSGLSGVAGLLISFTIGFVLYLFGVMYSCFGQAMLALFDIAVNTSPLTPDDKQSIIGGSSGPKSS